MILDLTLDSVKFPGLENFTPPFGTKKADNVGLTTGEGCQNIAKPWQDQRPLVISENSSFSGNIERNGLIEIDTASITLTMVSASFTGCELKIITTFSSGSATVLIGATSHTLNAMSLCRLVYDGTTWQFERQLDDALTASNVAVAVADFVVDSTYTDYGYKAEIALPGVNANFSPDVRFSLADAISGVFAPVADTDTDKVIIYASEVPAADITIPVIICTPLSA